MRVLVACEFSGAVRRAFQAAGHCATSVDYLPAEDGAQSNSAGVIGFHVRDDILSHLRSFSSRYDLMIAHPPCTYLARCGARWWADNRDKQVEALDLVRKLLAAPVPRIALENPPGAIGTQIRKADQYIQPWQYGHGETKMTGLWLKGLPKLVPSNIVEGRAPRVHYAKPGPDRWKERSRTLPGIAAAMAAQWGGRIRYPWDGFGEKPHALEEAAS